MHSELFVQDECVSDDDNAGQCAAKPNCGGLRTGTGAIITHAPSTMHQIAMLIGSFEPSGRGASADTMNKIQEEMVARMMAAGFLLSRGKLSAADAFGRQLGPASCATILTPGYLALPATFANTFSKSLSCLAAIADNNSFKHEKSCDPTE